MNLHYTEDGDDPLTAVFDEWVLPTPAQAGLVGISWTVEDYVKACMAYCAEMLKQDMEDTELLCYIDKDDQRGRDERGQLLFPMSFDQIGLGLHIDFEDIAKAMLGEPDPRQREYAADRLEALAAKLRGSPNG